MHRQTLIIYLSRYDHHPDLHSFPTRRSSDLAPGSLLAASEIEQKLLYMNLFRMGVIDMFTLAEILGIPKFGNPPDGADTVIARLQWQQQNGLGPSGNAAGRPQSGNTLPRMVTKTS